MSNGQEDVSSQPLVIVRRRRNVDEEHHGGVWKIAYADFMTAMMAFFLVMWLINAADKKTIVQVAAYFNPMRLTDRVASPKGLEDLSEMDSKQSEEKNKKGANQKVDGKQKLNAPHATKDNVGEALDVEAQKISAAAGGKSAEARQEEALFDNPGELLDSLAHEAKSAQAMTAAASSNLLSAIWHWASASPANLRRSPCSSSKPLRSAGRASAQRLVAASVTASMLGEDVLKARSAVAKSPFLKASRP